MSRDAPCTCHLLNYSLDRYRKRNNVTVVAARPRTLWRWAEAHLKVSQGALRTMQHRLWDCYRQQRWPVPEYASDALTALTVFLQKQAAGGEINVPSIKR